MPPFSDFGASLWCGLASFPTGVLQPWNGETHLLGTSSQCNKAWVSMLHFSCFRYMYIYIYIHMYVCLFVCMHAHLHTYMWCVCVRRLPNCINLYRYTVAMVACTQIYCSPSTTHHTYPFRVWDGWVLGFVTHHTSHQLSMLPYSGFVSLEA